MKLTLGKICGLPVILIASALTGCSPVPADVADGEAASEIGPVEKPGKSSDAQKYIAASVEVYDVKAAYQNSLLDGRVPGLTLKIKNTGGRTLERVEIRAVFKDQDGNPISEETYLPVFSGGYDNDPPLRPGYIWQNERGTFYAAKSVPSEWDGKSVDVEVISVDFGETE